MFQDVEHAGLKGAAPVFGGKPGGGIAEIHLAAFGHHHGIGITDGVCIHAVGQHGDLGIGCDGQQTLDGIGGNQVALGIKVKSQHPSAGVGKHLLVGAISVHPQDVAAEYGGVELAIRSELDVLGAHFTIQVDDLKVGELAVGGMWAGVSRRSGGVPHHRVDGHRPSQQVQGQQGHQGNNRKRYFFHRMSPQKSAYFARAQPAGLARGRPVIRAAGWDARVFWRGLVRLARQPVRR